MVITGFSASATITVRVIVMALLPALSVAVYTTA